MYFSVTSVVTQYMCMFEMFSFTAVQGGGGGLDLFDYPTSGCLMFHNAMIHAYE